MTQVLDDARHDLAPLAANKVGFSDMRQPCSSGAGRYVTYHPVTLPDIDGDHVAEIHSFEFIDGNLAASPGVFTELYRIPQENLLTMGTSGSDYRFNHETISTATGDVTSDARDNIVFYSQISDPSDQGVQVWGLDEIDGWKQFEFFGTDFENSGSPLRAKMLLPDVELDQDSMSLEYDNGSYRLIFTEPIVLAVPTLDLKATKAGIVGGLSIGGGAGFDISTRGGEETIYQGTVANIAAANSPQDALSFGLFAYIVDDSANPQPFEVLNLWVVPPPN